MKSYIRSFLDYYNSDDSVDSQALPQFPELEMKFIRNYDAHYHTIEMKVLSEFITLVFNIDLYKKSPGHVITLLSELVEQCYDMKNGNNGNMSNPIVFDGDAKCFFRPVFQITMTHNDQIILESSTYTQNRCNERFKIILPLTALTKMTSELEQILKELEELE